MLMPQNLNKSTCFQLWRLKKLGIMLMLFSITAGLMWKWNKLNLNYRPSIHVLLPQIATTADEGNNTIGSIFARFTHVFTQEPTYIAKYSASIQGQPSTNIVPHNTSHAGIETRKNLKPAANPTYSPVDDTSYYIAGIHVVPLTQQNLPKKYVKEVENMQRNIAQQMTTKGFVSVEDSAVLMIHTEAQEIAKTKSTLPDTWTEQLGFQPANLQDTTLDANSKYIGLIPSKDMLAEATNHSGINSGERYISRLYQSDNLGLVKLTEHAHSQPPVITPEFMNDTVNGIPAYYYVQKGSSGKTLATLAWVTESRGYTLESTFDVTKNSESKEIFFNLANSIPAE